MKHYLGDGVYAEWDGQQIILTTSNGLATLDTIYLEPSVYNNLVFFVEKMLSQKDVEE